MRINFERSGGYANIQIRYQVNTDDLSSGVSEELLSLVESAHILELNPADVAPRIPRPDVFNYRLSLSAEGKEITLTMDDLSAPGPLRPLLSRLQELALQQKRA